MADIFAEEVNYVSATSPNPYTPVPSQPFPFLKLPREIRDPIYYYALLRPRNGPSLNPTDICYFDRPVPADASYKSSWTPYWGTKESTRLFLVNRQFSSEAIEIFYSTYPFHFPATADVTFANATLRDCLSPWARSLITRIGFKSGLLCTPGPFCSHDEEMTRRAIEAVLDLLPNVKQIILTLMLTGFDVPEYQVIEIVTRALKMVGPLKGFAGLSLEPIEHDTDQQTRIMREVRETLGCQ